jgi:DNA polymerase IV
MCRLRHTKGRGAPRESIPVPQPMNGGGSETTFSEDLLDTARIEAGVIAMVDDVWAWCEKMNCFGRTVTVKIKWADCQISSRSRSIEAQIGTRAKLHELARELIRSVFPPPKAIRLVGVTLFNFQSSTSSSEAELPFREI